MRGDIYIFWQLAFDNKCHQTLIVIGYLGTWIPPWIEKKGSVPRTLPTENIRLCGLDYGVYGDAAATVVSSNCVVRLPVSAFMTPSVAIPNLRVPVAVIPVDVSGMPETTKVAGAVGVKLVLEVMKA